MEKIKLLVVDDIPQTRKDIIRLLYFEDDMTVVGEAADGSEALQIIGQTNPDVVLMDINMPQMDGITATERVCQMFPQVAVIIISIQGESEYLKKAMVAGARDYLVKPLGSEEMATTIRSVYKQQQRRVAHTAAANNPAPYSEQTTASHHFPQQFADNYNQQGDRQEVQDPYTRERDATRGQTRYQQENWHGEESHQPPAYGTSVQQAEGRNMQRKQSEYGREHTEEMGFDGFGSTSAEHKQMQKNYREAENAYLYGPQPYFNDATQHSADNQAANNPYSQGPKPFKRGQDKELLHNLKSFHEEEYVVPRQQNRRAGKDLLDDLKSFHEEEHARRSYNAEPENTFMQGPHQQKEQQSHSSNPIPQQRQPEMPSSFQSVQEAESPSKHGADSLSAHRMDELKQPQQEQQSEPANIAEKQSPTVVEPRQEAKPAHDSNKESAAAAIEEVKQTAEAGAVPKTSTHKAEKEENKAQKVAQADNSKQPQHPQKTVAEAKSQSENNSQASTAEKPCGFVTAVFCGKGGVGKTTLATNLAVVLAHQEKKKVALVDFDLQFGDVSVLLNLSDGKNISNLIQDADTITTELLENYMIRHFTGIDILPAPLFPQEAEYVTPEHTDHILTLLKKSYDYVIVDTAASFNEVNLQAMDMADQILLVTTRDIVTIKNTKTSLNILESLNYRDKIRVVLNRSDQDLGVGIPDLEKGLDITVSHHINGDEKALVGAMNKGVPVVVSHSGSEIGRSYKRICDRMMGNRPKKTHEKHSKSIINRMFSL